MKYKELLTKIKEKGGVKLVTVQTEDEMDIFKIDDTFQDDFLFLQMVKKGMQNGGILNIRQFVGEEKCLLASVLLQHNTYFPMNPSDAKEMYAYDKETGEPLEPEQGVTFVMLHELQIKVDFSFHSGIELKILTINGTPLVRYNEEEEDWETSFQMEFEYDGTSYETTVYFGVGDAEEDGWITTISFQFEDAFLEETSKEQLQIVQSLLEEWIEQAKVDENYLTPLYEHFYDKHGFQHPDALI